MVKNRILFETNDDFTDNCRALFDYMVANGYNKKYELVWLVHEPEKYKKYQAENVKFVQQFQEEHDDPQGSSLPLCPDLSLIFFTPRRLTGSEWQERARLFVDLWHGCGYKANKNNRKVFFDYCLVPGDVFIETKKEFFGCSSRKLLATWLSPIRSDAEGKRQPQAAYKEKTSESS